VPTYVPTRDAHPRLLRLVPYMNTLRHPVGADLCVGPEVVTRTRCSAQGEC